jgi:hypothetical protein
MGPFMGREIPEVSGYQFNHQLREHAVLAFARSGVLCRKTSTETAKAAKIRKAKFNHTRPTTDDLSLKW